MEFLLENVLASVLCIIMLNFTIVLKSVNKDKSGKEILLDIIMFNIWYLLNIIFSHYFPNVAKVYKIFFAFGSLPFLYLISNFIKDRFYFY